MSFIRKGVLEIDSAQIIYSSLTFGQSQAYAKAPGETDAERIQWTLDVVAAGLNNAMREDVKMREAWTPDTVRDYFDAYTIGKLREAIFAFGNPDKKGSVADEPGEEAAAT